MSSNPSPENQPGGKSYFYIDPRTLPKPYSSGDDTGQFVGQIPQPILELDRKVHSSLIDILESARANELRLIMEKSKDYLTYGGWQVAFRAVYMEWWCRELAALRIMRKSALELLNFKHTVLHRVCHHCKSTSGHRLPFLRNGKMVHPGDVYRNPGIPQEMKIADRLFQFEIGKLRGQGIFDEIMREIAQVLTESQASILAYKIKTVATHFSREAPAMRVGTWLSPAMEGVEKSSQVNLKDSYFWKQWHYYKQCSFCNGLGTSG